MAMRLSATKSTDIKNLSEEGEFADCGVRNSLGVLDMLSEAYEGAHLCLIKCSDEAKPVEEDMVEV